MNIPSLPRAVSLPTTSFDVVRWWTWGLQVFVVVLVLLVAWSASVYLRVAGGGAIDTDVAENTPIIDQASLRAVRSVLDSRAVEEQKYESGAYSYKDPSQ